MLSKLNTRMSVTGWFHTDNNKELNERARPLPAIPSLTMSAGYVVCSTLIIVLIFVLFLFFGNFLNCAETQREAMMVDLKSGFIPSFCT